MRGRICADLGYMGIEVDESANNQNAFLISSERSKVGVHVIESNEALVIATRTRDMLIKREEG